MGHSQLAKFQLADLYVGDLPMIERVHLDDSTDEEEDEAESSGAESDASTAGNSADVCRWPLQPNKKPGEVESAQGKKRGEVEGAKKEDVACPHLACLHFALHGTDVGVSAFRRIAQRHR
eukprot:468875-Rhodomonas_salina.1